MASQITIQLRGSGVDAENVRLEEFTEQLSGVRNALRETERFITGQEPVLYYRVVDLQHGSPTTVVLEAASETTPQPRAEQVASVVVRHFTANLRFLGHKKRPSRTATVPVLESYREMTAPLEKHVTEVVIRSGKHSALINAAFKKTLEEVLGPEEVSYGSISGTIEALNIHNTTKFTLYPTVGPTKVYGHFTQDLRADITRAVDKYVTVYGELRYKTWDKFPYAIVARGIEVHEPPVTRLPDIRGMAPHAGGELTADEFIDRLRDETW